MKHEPCRWPMPHRDKHGHTGTEIALCGCICALAKGHHGHHECAYTAGDITTAVDNDGHLVFNGKERT